MECVTVNIIWKAVHSRWTVVLHLEWSVLQLPSNKTEEHEDWTHMTNGIFLNFELDDVALTEVMKS